MSRQGQGQGHSRKHTSAHKHSGTSKHHPSHHAQRHRSKQGQFTGGPQKATVKGHHAGHSKPRGLALGEAVPCCAAEAVAASLRLAGWPVGDEDVFALHEAAGGSAVWPVSIAAALEAASVAGLAGVRPRGWSVLAWSEGAELSDDVFDGGESLLDEVEPHLRASFHLRCPAGVGNDGDLHPGPVHETSVILGAELPGAHALAVDGPGVWSWGEWHPWSCFPDTVIEEAWAVVWP